MLLRVRIGARPHPVPVGKVSGGREDLLAVENPAVALALRLQPHGGRVRSRVGLRIADSEFDIRVQDLRKEFLLQFFGGMGDQGLADDADTLADLRRSHRRQLFVEEVFVEPLTIAAAVFLGPGDAQPALLGELLHERAALGGVTDLRHVLARQIHHVDVTVRLEELAHLPQELSFFFGKFKVHDASFSL